MNIPNLKALKGLAGLGRAFVIAHRPEMLFGASVVATVGSTVLAAKGGYEARGIVDNEQRRRDNTVNGDGEIQASERLTTKEKAQLTWKCYVPAGLALTTAVGSTTGLHLIHVKEKKALVQSGLVALEEAKQQYKAWERETISALDDGDMEKIQGRIYDQIVDSDGIATMKNSDGVVEEFYLVRDNLSGRDIWTNERRITDALNETNNWMNNEGDVELNHFYSLAGYGHLPMGDDLGWSGALIDLKWDSIIRDDGRPVRRFTFRDAPEKDYTGKYA